MSSKRIVSVDGGGRRLGCNRPRSEGGEEVRFQLRKQFQNI